jgi:hypothetical protein
MVTDKNYFSMYFYFSRNIYILHNYSAYGVYIKNGATFDYDSISVYTVTVRCDDGDDTVDAALTVILIRNDVRYFVLWFSLHSEHPPHLWIVNGDNTVDAVLSTLYDINLVFNVVRKPEDAKGVIRRYQRGNQKIPKG